MRLSWGRDDGPFFFSCPGRKPHERCERGPFYFAWGCFRDFVSGLRGVPPHTRVEDARERAYERVEDARERAYEALRCVRDTRSLVLRAHGESIQLNASCSSRLLKKSFCEAVGV